MTKARGGQSVKVMDGFSLATRRVEALRGRDFVHDVSSVMRVEGEG